MLRLTLRLQVDHLDPPIFRGEHVAGVLRMLLSVADRWLPPRDNRTNLVADFARPLKRADGVRSQRFIEVAL